MKNIFHREACWPSARLNLYFMFTSSKIKLEKHSVNSFWGPIWREMPGKPKSRSQDPAKQGLDRRRAYRWCPGGGKFNHCKINPRCLSNLKNNSFWASGYFFLKWSSRNLDRMERECKYSERKKMEGEDHIFFKWQVDNLPNTESLDPSTLER